jgi:hypothetical protein
MTWTYSGNPGASDLDAVRFMIGDTDTTSQQLTDEEIGYLLTQHGSAQAAGITACRSLAAKFSRYADQTTGSISVSYSQLSANYRALVRDILFGAVVEPYAGGISKQDMAAVDADSDAVTGFAVGMHDRDED